ncbi:MAG TPA: hypothetical protein VK403_13880 [Allosphingosinicella sp.]|nr:hypothetical protein [Allosphingosinicella sp.]
MPLPEFLSFVPVPLKPRHDGWTPELQLRFIVALARGATIDGAASAVGKTRTTAYALRNRPGAESFAAAWDAALVYAKRRRLAGSATALPPVPSTPGEAAAMLDPFYPGWRGEAGKADEAGRA